MCQPEKPKSCSVSSLLDRLPRRVQWSRVQARHERSVEKLLQERNGVLPAELQRHLLGVEVLLAAAKSLPDS